MLRYNPGDVESNLLHNELICLQADQIVAMGAFGGRMDHCLANINTLYTASTLSKVPLFLFYDNSMACLLDKVKHYNIIVHILQFKLDVMSML